MLVPRLWFCCMLAAAARRLTNFTKSIELACAKGVKVINGGPTFAEMKRSVRTTTTMMTNPPGRHSEEDLDDFLDFPPPPRRSAALVAL